MAESIINALMKVKGLRVPSKTSSFSLKEKGSTFQEIGERLKVDSILEGSVQKSGDRIRISARLVNVTDESLLWSEQWNKDLDDIFAIQDEIALAIMDKLKIHLLGEEREAVTKHYTDNVKAYNLYLLGRHFWNERTEESNKRAIEYFEQAIESDPNYALAHVGLADSYAIAAGYYFLPSEAAFSKAKNAVMKALELDDTLSEAYTTLAALKSDMDWDWKGAEEGYQQAIKLDPNYATAHHWYSYILSNMGQHEEAIQEAKRAQELDPLSHIMSRGLGGVYLNARQYEQAIEELERAIEFGSKAYFGHLWLFYAYHQSKQHRESIGVLKEFAGLMGFSDQRALIEKIYTESGYSEALREVIPIIPDPFHIAAFYTLLGEKDQAFEWLEKAYKEHSLGLGGLKEASIFDSIRSDARFKALLKKINLD